MASLTPSQQGFQLEDYIHNALSIIPDVECLKEQDIRTRFSDQSINGVDHWIRHGEYNILIQDKWKESATTQQEVSQFLSCVERIQSRCSQTDTFYLIWAGKLLPTNHSITSLRERNVTILNCNISIEALARLVILEVCETLGIEPIIPLKIIPVMKRERVKTTPSTREIIPTVQPAPVVSYDDTDDGKADKTNMESIIQQIQNGPFRKLNNAQSNSTVPDVWQIYSSAFPQNTSKWFNESFKKIDYNAFVRTMKSVSCPTRAKHFMSYCFFFYCKLRFISVELSSLAVQYNTLREKMLGKKSVWARKLLQLKCIAEPMTDAEYRSQVINCQDYQINSYGPGGTIIKHSSGIENQFYQHYQVY
jgi:hypothetical protein